MRTFVSRDGMYCALFFLGTNKHPYPSEFHNQTMEAFKFMFFQHENSANMENISSLMLYSHETFYVAFNELSDFHGGVFV